MTNSRSDYEDNKRGVARLYLNIYCAVNVLLSLLVPTLL